MFIKGEMFDKLLCCRRKNVEEDEEEEDKVVEEVVLQHTNNNKTEYISSTQLVEKLKGGTTAVVALVREKRLVVAWLGDSQALLVRQRSPVRMVQPHKPELPVERDRVEELGGCVINIQGTWRVLGQLAVSRAIGDCDYKPYVSSECDIKSLEIEGDEDFLILACDGLWDTLSPEAAVNVVYAYLAHNNGDTDGVGRCLVEAARSTGSEDNITAVVVFLRPVTTLMEEEAARVAQGQVPEPVPESVLAKDATPSSLNAIFSPPIHQFDYVSPTQQPPLYNPFDTPTPPQPVQVGGKEEGGVEGMEADVHTPLTIGKNEHTDEPMEGSEAPPNPSDLPLQREGEGAPPPTFNPNDAPTPTAEEVYAALAELDSIPDGVCESGEVEEEEEDEEEWSYYRTEPQTHPEGEDVLVSGGGVAVSDETNPAQKPSSPEADKPQQEDTLVQPDSFSQLNKEPFMEDRGVAGEAQLLDFEFQPNPAGMEQFNPDMNMPMEAHQAPVMEFSSDIIQASMESEKSAGKMLDLDIAGVGGSDTANEPTSPQTASSPPVPGSPRSVEGFVTSVELNTPEESLGTNFSLTQGQDLNGSGAEQPSAPFSVYVSSSPEPVSLEPSLQAPVDMTNASEVTNGHAEDDHMPQSPVEIVHAQSTVEVLASPSAVDKAEPEMDFVIPDRTPDLMTSSQILLEEPSDITFIPQPAVEPVAEEPVPVYIEGTTPVSEADQDSTSISGRESEIISPVSDKEPQVTSPLPDRDTEMITSPVPDRDTEIITSPVPDKVPETVTPVSEGKPDELLNDTAPTPEAIPEPEASLVSLDTEVPSAPPLAALEPEIVKEEKEHILAPSIENSVPPVNNEAVGVFTTPAIIEVVPEKVEAPVPEVKKEVKKAAPKKAEGVKSPTKPESTTSPTKTGRTPLRSTPGKATPARDTPTKTPTTRTPSTRTPVTKSTEKKPLSKPTTTRTPVEKASPKPTARTTTARPTTTKPAAPKPTTTRPAPRPTTTRAPTSTQPSGTKTLEKKTPKPPTPTVPRAALSKPSSATTKPAARPSPASRSTPPTTTTTKRPTTAPAKTDSSRLNGTAGKSTATTRTTTSTTTTRKPLSTTTRTTTKPAAEKETKNTTNRILSTTAKPAPRSTIGTTRTVASRTTSTGAGRTSVTESRTTTSRVNGTTGSTTTTTTKSRVTTKSTAAAPKATGTGAKKPVGSKLKAAAGTKAAPGKAEPTPVIEAAAPVVNGENKIAHEETSVEVVEKCAEEDTVMDKVITEAMTTQQVITTETTEVIVNGDH